PDADPGDVVVHRWRKRLCQSLRPRAWPRPPPASATTPAPARLAASSDRPASLQGRASAEQAARATRTPKAFVWLWLHLSWKAKTNTFPLPNEQLNKHGVNRKVKGRALGELEAAGLIQSRGKVARPRS